MKVQWDYSKLAQNYNKRPNYCPLIIDEIVSIAGLNKMSKVCDVGAGTGYLAKLFAPYVDQIHALEPNEQMRRIGVSDCKALTNIQWFAEQSEQTNMPGNEYDLVCFGSSFNVVDQASALKEAHRISKHEGWFLAIWNHRDLKSPLQQEIEAHIKSMIPSYNYGNRRQDQTQILEESARFSQLVALEQPMTVVQSTDDVITAWRSHATLQKQAKDRFGQVVSDIADIIKQSDSKTIETPYTSKAWLAQFKPHRT